MKIYAIAHSRNKDRFNNAKQQLSCLSTMMDNCCDAEIIEACMAKYLTSDELLENVAIPTALNAGEIGCSLSHLLVYKNFLVSNCDTAVVIEDDALIEECIENKRKIKECYDFLKRQDNPTILVLQSSIGKEQIEVYHSDTLTILKNKNVWCTHGYMINKKAAELVTELQTPVKFVADFFSVFHDICGIDILSLDKDLVLVHQKYGSESDIGHAYSVEILRKRAWLFRQYIRKEVRKKSIIEYLRYWRRTKKI